LSLPDTGDLHVLSAAIQCDAQHIVTENMRDFPKEALEPYDIEAIEADEFLAAPISTIIVANTWRSSRRRKPAA